MQGAAEETLRPANETLGSRGEEGCIWPHGTCAILSVPNWSQLGGQLLLPNRKPTSVPTPGPNSEANLRPNSWLQPPSQLMVPTSVPTPGPNYLSLTPGPNSWSQLSGSQLSGSHLLVPSLGPNNWTGECNPQCQLSGSQLSGSQLSGSQLSGSQLSVPTLGPNNWTGECNPQGPNSQGPISWSQQLDW